MRAKIALYKNPDFSAARESEGQQASMSDDEDGEPDFPEILLHELVDEMQEMQLDAGAEEHEDDGLEDGDDSMAGG